MRRKQIELRSGYMAKLCKTHCVSRIMQKKLRKEWKYCEYYPVCKILVIHCDKY